MIWRRVEFDLDQFSDARSRFSSPIAPKEFTNSKKRTIQLILDTNYRDSPLPAQDLLSLDPVPHPSCNLPHSPPKLLQLLHLPEILSIKLENLERSDRSHSHSRR